MRFRHSGKLGDAVYSLAAVHAFERSDFYVNSDGAHLGEEGARLLLPLIKAQHYIGETDIWTGQPFDHDLDAFREMNVCYLNLAACHLMTMNLSYQLLSLPWLTVPRKAVLPGSGIVFARSAARRGAPGVMETLYGQLGRDAMFVGTEEEWQRFCQECGPISYAPTANLLHLILRTLRVGC